AGSRAGPGDGCTSTATSADVDPPGADLDRAAGAGGEFRDEGGPALDLAGGQRHVQGDYTGVVGTQHSDPAAAQVGLDAAGIGVRDLEVMQGEQVALEGADLGQAGAYGVPIGPHQAAGTEQHAAEPPGDHRDHVTDLVTPQHLQHRG